MAEQGRRTPSSTPPHHDHITTTEGVRETAHAAHDEARSTHPPEGELTIIEPPTVTKDAAEAVAIVDKMTTALEQVSTLSQQLESSDQLAKVLVAVHLAVQELATLKLHLQGYDVP